MNEKKLMLRAVLRTVLGVSRLSSPFCSRPKTKGKDAKSKKKIAGSEHAPARFRERIRQQERNMALKALYRRISWQPKAKKKRWNILGEKICGNYLIAG